VIEAFTARLFCSASRIVAVSSGPNGLDGLISADTRIVDDTSLTLLPAFIDTHNHLL